jgi:hypothetical protein
MIRLHVTETPPPARRRGEDIAHAALAVGEVAEPTREVSFTHRR